jgi:maleate isomerase
VPDVTGYRIKFGVIIPSTNTVVEADYNRMAPPGVTFHSGRMYIAEPALDSDAAFEALLREIRTSRAIAVRDVVTCKPDYIVMGMSAETFWGGAKGNARFIDEVREQSGGLGVSTGASACRAGLAALGCTRIAVLSPYQPVADANVTRFFEESGVTVVRFTGLRCPTATAIAEVTERDLIPVLRQLDGADVDAIVQVGTNLSMVRLADEAERWLGKPVLAINAVTLWHALRANGIMDRFPHCGALLRDH